MPNVPTSAIEARLRRSARAAGLVLTKSWVRSPHLDDLGGYRLIDPRLNAVVAGARFELDLDAVADFLADA